MKTLLTLCSLLVAMTGCDPETSTSPLRVMTRNVYVGGDIDRVINATTPEELVVAVLVTWQEINANDFNRRAEALADEIEAERPDIIGLQEITTFRTQTPGDAAVGGSVPATDVAWDYLQILQDALADRGLDYRVAGVVQDADVEMPMVISENPLAFMDVRMTDYDAVLVSADVEVANVVTRNYETALEVVVGGAVPITIPRGYIVFDATKDGETIRFASSHLEPTGNPALEQIQQAQAVELIQAVGNGAAIIVGDLNSPAPNGGSYKLFLNAGFSDAWTDTNPGVAGPSCCFDTSLLEDIRQPFERIDLVLHRSSNTLSTTAKEARYVGKEPVHEIGDIYPSDHMGLCVDIDIDGK